MATLLWPGWRRPVGWRLAAITVVVVAALGPPSAGRASAPVVPCLGFSCSDGRHAGHGPVTALAGGPEALDRQTRPGLYRVRTASGAAVAYVIPVGGIDRAPVGIRGLPVLRALRAAVGAADSTVVVFGPYEATATPRSELGDYTRCPYGWFCLFEDTGFNDRMLQFQDIGYWQSLGVYGFNDQADSVANRRGADSLLAEHTGGDGDRRCFDSHSVVSDLGGFGDDASSVFNSTSDGRC